jgi:hypothetical protein
VTPGRTLFTIGISLVATAALSSLVGALRLGPGVVALYWMSLPAQIGDSALARAWVSLPDGATVRWLLLGALAVAAVARLLASRAAQPAAVEPSHVIVSRTRRGERGDRAA